MNRKQLLERKKLLEKRHLIIRHLCARIYELKYILKKYPNTEWAKTKLKEYEVNYEKITGHSATTK